MNIEIGGRYFLYHLQLCKDIERKSIKIKLYSENPISNSLEFSMLIQVQIFCVQYTNLEVKFSF